MLIYDDFSKKCHVIFKKVLLLFWKFSSYLVCVRSFKSIYCSFLFRKKYGNNFTRTPRKRLRGQNTLVGIGLIELTKSSDTLNYKPFFKHFLKNILHIFLLLVFFVLKTELYFTVFYLAWVGIRCYGVKGSVFLVFSS